MKTLQQLQDSVATQVVQEVVTQRNQAFDLLARAQATVVVLSSERDTLLAHISDLEDKLQKDQAVTE